ncbi:MAG: DUF58 domain-containing protein, partial [Actinomycetota bacterium]|nr:DUF58 domain-containing protein [Actinomycetota bacterium]
VAELAPGDHAEIVAEGVFVARGRHHIDTFGVAAAVPLGLATGPELESRGTRFIVWPRPVHLGEAGFEAAASESARHTPRARAGGESLELLGLRPYRPGDSVRDLHAASWARFGEPVVRAYQAEERARVAIVLDADLANEERFEGAVSIAAGLLADAAQAGAEIVLVVLDDDHPTPIALGRGRGAIDAGLDALACVRGGEARARTEPDELVFARHARALGDDAQVCFVTPASDGSGARRAAQLARAAADLRIFVLEPKPARFGRRRDSVSAATASVGAGGEATGSLGTAGLADVRRIPASVWSGRLEQRRRPPS